jgi:hypothetical protein
MLVIMASLEVEHGIDNLWSTLSKRHKSELWCVHSKSMSAVKKAILIRVKIIPVALAAVLYFSTNSKSWASIEGKSGGGCTSSREGKISSGGREGRSSVAET